MAYFFCRLIPPRPDFAQTMSDAERAAMQAHVAYWTGQTAPLIFGPVGDPKGPWGLGIFEAENEAALQQLLTKDPAITAGIGARYESLPMLRAVVRDSLKTPA